MSQIQHVESPCVSICVMDEATGYCKGCLRTRDEIACWSRADNETRLAILAKLRERLTATGKVRRETRRNKPTT